MFFIYSFGNTPRIGIMKRISRRSVDMICFIASISSCSTLFSVTMCKTLVINDSQPSGMFLTSVRKLGCVWERRRTKAEHCCLNVTWDPHSVLNNIRNLNMLRSNPRCYDVVYDWKGQMAMGNHQTVLLLVGLAEATGEACLQHACMAHRGDRRGVCTGYSTLYGGLYMCEAFHLETHCDCNSFICLWALCNDLTVCVLVWGDGGPWCSICPCQYGGGQQ